MISSCFFLIFSLNSKLYSRILKYAGILFWLWKKYVLMKFVLITKNCMSFGRYLLPEKSGLNPGGKITKKQCGGVYFYVYGIAFWNADSTKTHSFTVSFQRFCGLERWRKLNVEIKIKKKINLLELSFILVFRTDFFIFCCKRKKKFLV